jgi:anti-anti-sigma regulatory factor
LVLVDVSEISHLSSTFLAALLDTHRACRQRGGGAVIRHANRKMTELLRRAVLNPVFEVEPT